MKTEEQVKPTPVGPWEISIPSLQTRETRRDVRSIKIYVVMSYVPCSRPSCKGMKDFVSADAPDAGNGQDGDDGDTHHITPHNPTGMQTWSTLAMLSVAGVCGVVASTCIAVVGRERRDREEEQHEGEIGQTFASSASRESRTSEMLDDGFDDNMEMADVRIGESMQRFQSAVGQDLNQMSNLQRRFVPPRTGTIDHLGAVSGAIRGAL